MKLNRICKIGFVLLLMLLFMTHPVYAAKAKFGVSVKRTRLLAKEEQQIRCKKADSPYYRYTFKSSKKKVATVSEDGVIKAKKAGTAVITVKGKYNKNGKTAKWKTKITIKVYTCKLNHKTLAMNQGEKKKLKIKGTTLKRKIRWESSDEATAKVSSKGKITAKQDGTVTIFCHVGSYRVLKCKVTITAKALSSQSLKMMVNKTHTYGAVNIADEVRKDKKSAKGITYRVSNPSFGHMSGDIYYADRHGSNEVTAFTGKYKKKFTIRQYAWCAHRGYLDIRPENTIDAFEAAGLFGAGLIETDIRVTADDQIVCLHDPDLYNMTGAPASDTKVKNLTYEEIRSYTINNGNGLANCQYRFVPRLADYLAICRKYGMIAMLEVKHLGTTQEQKERTCHEIVRLLRVYNLEKRAILIANSVSGHDSMLAFFRDTTGSAIPIASTDSGCWKTIKDLSNAYRTAALSPIGTYVISDYSPLFGKKGKAWSAYVRS